MQCAIQIKPRDCTLSCLRTQVRKTIPAERLLEFRATDGWGPLCAFLGVPGLYTLSDDCVISHEYFDSADDTVPQGQRRIIVQESHSSRSRYGLCLHCRTNNSCGRPIVLHPPQMTLISTHRMQYLFASSLVFS